FGIEEPMPLVLEADWESFLVDRSDSADYYPATLHFEEKGELLKMPMRIRVRGNFRRKSSICSIPPIRLRFRRSQRQGTVFHPHKKLKLVSSCQGDLYVIREYLGYKLYQLFAEESYQVRLVNITLRDHNPLLPEREHLSFVIEDEDHLADRLSLDLIEHINPEPKMLDQADLLRLTLFHFVIGNMDWDIPMEKNLSFLRQDSLEMLTPVPYDFDWSGLVNAPYTMLPEDFERRQVKPLCVSSTLAQQVWQEVIQLEDAVDELLKAFPHLPGAERRILRQYCRNSFRMMRKDDFWQQLVETECEEEVPAH
ncbi:MAG: hypothetical protein AAFV07_12960, partial [Bacteroidota bacterium]